MHYTGQVYRHPVEGSIPLLEVTAGCSHNKCTFCTMYRNTQFGVSPLAHVEADLQELKNSGMPITRLFLVNGEPLVLSTEKLIEIGELINKYFPNIETITSYASVMNLKNKSLEDLKALRALKFNQLHVGLESTYDPALKMMNKGFTKEDAYDNIKKLSEAGIQWDAIVMTGVAGKGNGETHIRETVDLLNKYPPYMVSVMTTSVSKGSELEILRDEGQFVECTELEKLEEELLLLDLLDFDDAYFFGSHVFNLVPISGSLKNKSNMMNHIKRSIKETEDSILNSVVKRANI